MIEITKLILDTAQGIFNAIQGKKSQRKNEISSFFLAISRELDIVVEKLKNGEVPHGSCATIQHFATEFPTKLEGVLDKVKAHKYGSALHQAHNVEMLHITVKENPACLVDLEKASGLFRGAALTVLL